MNLFNLEGKTAVVTGASRGLGREMAVGLAEAGARVTITDVLNVKDTVEEIRRLGKETLGIKVDVTKRKDIQAMVQKTLREFGKIDILVNNAGILWSGSTERMKEKDWDKILDVNLKGQFLCAQEVGKQMIKQKSGKIINIASVAGLHAFNQIAAYNASKAGVILLTKSLAVDWGKYGIQVNAICPGVFATAMTGDLLNDKNFMKMVKTRVPLSRIGEPKELKGAVTFLASDASSYLTGHALVVDGGWTAGL